MVEVVLKFLIVLSFALENFSSADTFSYFKYKWLLSNI